MATTGILDNTILRRTLIAIMVVAAFGIGIYVVTEAKTGANNTSASKPVSVDRLIPESGAEVLRQSAVGVDLALGYDAYLIVNGIEIKNIANSPTDDGLQRTLTPDGYTIIYTPGPDRRVPALATDANTVTAMIWRQEDGPTNAQPTYWTFNAA